MLDTQSIETTQIDVLEYLKHIDNHYENEQSCFYCHHDVSGNLVSGLDCFIVKKLYCIFLFSYGS